MRSYPANSPQASARILAIMLLVDGHADHNELKTLESHPGLRQLGLNAKQVEGILRALCHDLMIAANHDWNMTLQLSPLSQQQLLAEITDPVLQASLIQLSHDLISTDGYAHPAETAFIEAMEKAWKPIAAWQLAARVALRKHQPLRAWRTSNAG